MVAARRGVNQVLGLALISTSPVWIGVSVVQLLLERGDVDINAKDSDEWTPLLVAVEKWYDAAAVRLERGDVDVNAKDNDG